MLKIEKERLVFPIYLGKIESFISQRGKERNLRSQGNTFHKYYALKELKYIFALLDHLLEYGLF
jgi:hypothetical protein